MLRHPLVVALVLLTLAQPSAAPAASAGLSSGVFVEADGTATPASVSYEGACNGVGALTVTLHRPGGDETRTVAVTSVMQLDACDAVMRCYECPPVPIPFAWALQGEGASLAGGGSGYYDAYRVWNLAYSMQGAFEGGVLEWRGVLSR